MQKMLIEPRKALNKAYLKIKPNRAGIELFKNNLMLMLDSIKEKESEEFHKNLISDFLKNTFYSPNHFINTKGRNDLVIHTGKEAKSTVGVIIEAKSPSNKAEMPSQKSLMLPTANKLSSAKPNAWNFCLSCMRNILLDCLPIDKLRTRRRRRNHKII